MYGYIHSIESFGTVDGPGIRLVIFLQGCPLRCLYCHNPDTWTYNIGHKKTVKEIVDIYIGIKDFLINGGITISGGEPLLQLDFLIELFKEFKKINVHTCIDTSGFYYNQDNYHKIEELMIYTDLVLLDIKHIDNNKHITLTSKTNTNILEFARYLSDIKKDVWIRYVLVKDYTNDDKDLYDLGYFLGSLKNIKALEVLPYHTLGIEKYKQLNIEYPLLGYLDLTKEDAKKARNIIINGIKDYLSK